GPPGQPTGLVITETTPGSVHGTFDFGGYVGDQWGRVFVKKAGSSVFVDTGILVKPDGSNEGSFDLSGLPPGSTVFHITPENKNGVQGTGSADVTITISGVTV